MRHKYLLLLSILTVCNSAFVFAQEQRGSVYAVIVGVSNYDLEGATDLPYSAKAATEMYELLDWCTAPDRMVLLTDQDATHDNVVAAMDRLFTVTAPEDVVILYLNGHGYMGGFATKDDYLDYMELKEIFKRTKARRKIIFADACYSGIMRSDELEERDGPKQLNGQRVCLFLSSRSDQTSWQRSDLKSGYFSFYLMAGLRGGADTNRDRIITARELFDFVNPRVKDESGGIQNPVMWGRFEHGMEILNWNK